MKEPTMSQELERVVQENLSDVQMGVFRREMDRLQSMEVEFVQLREEYKRLEESHKSIVTEYTGRKDEIEGILKREEDLNRRETEMAEQKTQLHIDNALIALRHENAEQRVTDHQDMVRLIFRGPVFQKSVVETRSGDVLTPIPMSDNGMIGSVDRQYTSDNKQIDTTEKQE